MNVTIDGVVCRAMVSCHHDGLFSFYDGKDWVRKAKTVPLAVLVDLPEGERLRVRSRMAEEGQVPS